MSRRLLAWWTVTACLLAVCIGHTATVSRTTGYVAINTRGEASASTLNLTVRDGQTDETLSGVTVSTAEHDYTTGASGRCTIDDITDGETITLSLSGYQTATTASQIPRAGTHYQIVDLEPIIRSQLPVVRSVLISPSSVLVIPGLRNPVAVDVGVDWNDPAGGELHVEAPLYSDAFDVVNSAHQLELVPSDLFNAVSSRQTIRVWATTPAGTSGAAFRTVDCYTIPDWLIDLGLDQTDGILTREGLRWDFDSGALPLMTRKANTADLGIVEVGFSLGCRGDVFMASSGDFDLSAGLYGGLEMKVKDRLPSGIEPYGGVDANGDLALAGVWYPAPRLREGQLDMALYGEGGVVVPMRTVLLLDPTGAGQTVTHFVDSCPPLADWLDDNAYIDLWLQLGADATVPFVVVNDEFRIEEVSVIPSVELGILGHIGTDLYVEASLTGGGKIWLLFVEDGVVIERWETVVQGRVEAGVAYFVDGEVKVGADFEWRATWPENGPSSMQIAETQQPQMRRDFQLMSRDYVKPGYAVFSGKETTRDLKQPGQMSILGVVTEHTFVSNVFPNTSAALAGASTTNQWVVYVHDDPELPQAQGTEIRYTHYDGATWSDPDDVTTNTQAEFFPTLSVDASNTPVAAWCRVRTPAYANTNDVVRFLGELDVVVSSYDSVSNAWTTPQILTTNEHMNISPNFAPSPTGELALWWLSNASNQLVGSTLDASNSASSVSWGFWNASNRLIESSSPVTTNLSAAFSPELLYNGTNAWFLWVQDVDYDLATTNNDSVLQYMVYDGTNWGGAQTLTSTNVVVSGVAGTVLTNGTPMIVWWQDGTMQYALGHDFSTGGVARADSGQLCIQDYSLVCNQQDSNVTLVFPSAASNSVNLAYRVYDHAAGLWGDDYPFVASNTIDFSISPLYVGDQLAAVYSRRILAYSNRTETIGGEAVDIRVPYRERTDLILARFDLDYDLAVTSLTTSDTYPPVLYVDVENAGDILVSNTVVEVRRGDTNGVVIGRVTNAVAMPAHTTARLNLPWTGISDPWSDMFVAVVDPDNAVSEFNEGNNVLSSRLLRTSLAIEDVGYGLRGVSNCEWSVGIKNPLARPVTNITAELRSHGTNGVVLASTNLTHLPAYTTHAVTLPFVCAGMSNKTPLVTTVQAEQQPWDSEQLTIRAFAAYMAVSNALPASVNGLRYLRMGYSNSVRIAWTPVGDGADGINVMRRQDTNDLELVGFENTNENMFVDIPESSTTNVGYQLCPYNAIGLGTPTAIMWTNLLVDANGDGLPDPWQIQHFGSTTNLLAFPMADADGDEVLNWEEYLFGTSPSDAGQMPAISLGVSMGGNRQVRWYGAKDQIYDISFSTNLNDWIPIEQNVLGVAGTNTWQIPADLQNSGRAQFYRVLAR